MILSKDRQEALNELPPDRIIIMEGEIQLKRRKWYEFYKKGWHKHTDLFRRLWWIRFNWNRKEIACWTCKYYEQGKNGPFCGHPSQTNKEFKQYAYYDLSCNLHEPGIAQGRIKYMKTLPSNEIEYYAGR